jgi:rubrerythrin
MSLLLTFMDLDKLYESSKQPVWLNRHELIDNIKNSGRNYNFDKYSDAHLYRIWERIQKEDAQKTAEAEYYKLLDIKQQKTCSVCDTRLTDGGKCPVCDIGEEDY